MSKILYETDGDVGVITLNDPPLNIFTEQHWDELIAAISAAATASHRALLLRSNGDHFTRGVDLKVFQGRNSADAAAMTKPQLAALQALEAMPIPVIAAVQGLCQAQGSELALASDLIVAGQSARFSQTETIIGATTFLGGVYRLARRCGMARALEIVYSAEIYTAATFERWNIINRVVADEVLDREARSLAKRLAAGPTRAYAMTKHLLRTYDIAGLAAADAALLSDAVALWDSRDMRESVAQLLGVERAKMRFVALSFTGA